MKIMKLCWATHLSTEFTDVYVLTRIHNLSAHLEWCWWWAAATTAVVVVVVVVGGGGGGAAVVVALAAS
jgi:hypothetical protein